MAACGHSAAFGCRMQKLLLCSQFKTLRPICTAQVRYRWQPPNPDEDILPSYAQRLAEWKAAHEFVPASKGVNIGLPYVSSTNSKTALSKLQQWTKKRVGRQTAARHKELRVDVNEVDAEWRKESGPSHICRVAEHYGIFDQMFDGAHFHATVPLNVWFDYDDEFVTPVKYGNVISAKEAAIQPSAEYEADDDSLWTLVMSSPDGNLEENHRELLHWMVGNIPGSEVQNGETLCNYLQPFPVKGAGFLRYVFVLYKQQHKLDFSSFQRNANCVALRERSFSTLDFYRKFQDSLTPAGLSFFQSEWDSSVRATFHQVLDMPEPKFEFIHPPRYFPAQTENPHPHAFNLYLDNYSDVKDLNEEVLKYKLKDLDPTKPPPPKPKYNNIDLLPPKTPSWYRIKTQYQKLGKYHWKQLYEDPKE